MLLLYVMVAAVVVAATGFFVWMTVGRAWLQQRGTRVVRCPETGRPAAVEIDGAHAMRTALHRRPELRLADCTRWPERGECGQECLTEIAESPDGCSTRAILTRWYVGADCALCGEQFGAIRWHDHPPGLLAPNGTALAWTGFRPEELQHVLETHEPICWNCWFAETFRREHGDRVLDRHREETRHGSGAHG